MSNDNYAPPMATSELAELLHELLTARKMSQVQLARAVGVSESHISRILTGDHNPSPGKLDLLAQALNVEPGILHRAYARTVGLRLETSEIVEGDLSAVIALWPSATPEQRRATRAVLEHFIETMDTGTTGTSGAGNE